MKKLPKTIIAVMMLISLVTSSVASESNAIASSVRPIASPRSLTTPFVLSQKETLNPAALAKYQQMAESSKLLAARDAAGANDTTKTVVIVVGIVVIVVSVAAMTTYGPGSLRDIWH